MGLFSRKKTGQTAGSSSRSTKSSEAHAAELRGRARRRLIGALVLVLTAVIVVPMLFDDPASQAPETPVVLPAMVPPVSQPDIAALTPGSDTPDAPGHVQAPTLTPDGAPDSMHTPDAPATDTPVQPAAPLDSDAASAAPATSASSAVPPAAEPDASPRTPPADQPARQPSQQPAAATPKPEPADERTDDGSLALALLEGRIPPSFVTEKPAAPQQGSFVLQVAAYSTEADAQTRRSALVDAGVTIAYIEQAVSNDKPTWRLRVGSLPTRDAAQAVQARLRALGYDNSLLLTQ